MPPKKNKRNEEHEIFGTILSVNIAQLLWVSKPKGEIWKTLFECSTIFNPKAVANIFFEVMEHKNNPKLIRDIITDAARNGQLKIAGCNFYLIDEELSLRAKGLLAIALDWQSRNDDYLSTSVLCENCKDDDNEVLNVINELVHHKYCFPAPNQDNVKLSECKYQYSSFKL